MLKHEHPIVGRFDDHQFECITQIIFFFRNYSGLKKILLFTFILTALRASALALAHTRKRNVHLGFLFCSDLHVNLMQALEMPENNSQSIHSINEDLVESLPQANGNALID